jgi:hypothetical protein
MEASMPLQYTRRLVVGTVVAVGLVAAGSAAAITANFERPRAALSIRRADPQPASFQIDDHQRMRELFIDPMTGRPR